ncbi:MAG TPA: DUF58 domain-containing protein [Chloroflexota bacterium]|nr:DUF58 domain-containing protein [Chloroflexota bacterium]
MTFPLCGLDPATLVRLDRVGLVAQRSSPLTAPGRRVSAQRGASPEFADYRDYAPGDDLRRVDWNVYARLDRLYLRLYRAEVATTAAVYLDCSASMGFAGKAATMGRVAAIVTYAALQSQDRVSIGVLGGPMLSAQSGLPAVPRAFRFIANHIRTPSGDAVGPIRPNARRPGVALLVSDLLTDADWRSDLLRLRAQGWSIGIIQLLAREELSPDLRGEYRLRDVESGEHIEISGSGRLDQLYRQALDQHLTAIGEFCRRHEMAYAMIADDMSDAGVLNQLQAAGIIA